jgi:hypothetical protein
MLGINGGVVNLFDVLIWIYCKCSVYFETITFYSVFNPLVKQGN